jgi:hypothetical protein
MLLFENIFANVTAYLVSRTVECGYQVRAWGWGVSKAGVNVPPFLDV